MTPDDVAEIRAETADCYLQHKVVPNSHHVIWDLCDALTEAWADCTKAEIAMKPQGEQ